MSAKKLKTMLDHCFIYNKLSLFKTFTSPLEVKMDLGKEINLVPLRGLYLLTLISTLITLRKNHAEPTS